jgi:K+-sensing histidine kinase KdpD
MKMIEGSAMAVGLVLATTALFLLIGRNVLGEGVVALLYLVPIAWSTTRWGQLPGLCAALTAALTFNFFFIPPFYTFQIGSVEGWLMLIIFLAVATVIVGRIQYGLQRAHQREREALFMYELSTSLAGARTPEAVARTLARQLQQMLQAELVQVMVEPAQATDSILVGVPTSTSAAENPDQILPMLAPHRLVGEIRLWRGRVPLPTANGILLQNFAEQGALAIERVQDLSLAPAAGNGSAA